MQRLSRKVAEIIGKLFSKEKATKNNNTIQESFGELEYTYVNGVKMYDRFQVNEYYHSRNPQKRKIAIHAVSEMMDEYVQRELEKIYGKN